MIRRSMFALWFFTFVLLFFVGCGGDEGAEEADAGPKCGALPECLDKEGKPDIDMCADNIDFLCYEGCCVEKKPCKVNADCLIELGSVSCKDSSLMCACDGATGLCFQSACISDADCSEGQYCNNGGCSAPPALKTLAARLLRPFWIARPGDKAKASLQLGAQARDDSGKVDPKAAFSWTLSGDGFTLADGELTAGDKAGLAKIKVALAGGKSSNSAEATLWNLGPLPAGKALRISVADELTQAPVSGEVIVVGLADQSTPAEALKGSLVDGQVTFDAVEFPCDIHVISKTYEPVSLLRLTPKDQVADLLLTANQRYRAALNFDQDGELNDKAVVVNGDVISGRVDYKGKGEAGLGLTSLGVGGELLSFNLDALIGPQVKRYFHPDAPSIVGDVDKQQELPGGVTFNFTAPVIDTYVLAAPPGRKILWSLAGRVEIAAIGPQIAAIASAVSGGMDVAKVVGALLPYLQNFYSQVLMDVEFGDKPSASMKIHDLAPSMGLYLKSKIEPATLPATQGAWADLMVIVAGAMMPDGQLVPLGISAGTDLSGKKGEKADGEVDGDSSKEGQQPLPLTLAPLHSGLRVGAPNFVAATAAIIVGGNGKKEGGSIVLSDIGLLKKSYNPGPFLPFAEDASYDKASRELKISKVADVDFYRVIFNGPENHRWVAFVPKDALGKTIVTPDLTKWGADVDMAKDPKRVFVGAFELRKAAANIEDVLTPGVLSDLVRQVKRTSFIDVRK